MNIAITENTDKKILCIRLDNNFISENNVIEVYGIDIDLYYKIETEEEFVYIPLKSKQYFVKCKGYKSKVENEYVEKFKIHTVEQTVEQIVKKAVKKQEPLCDFDKILICTAN